MKNIHISALFALVFGASSVLADGITLEQTTEARLAILRHVQVTFFNAGSDKLLIERNTKQAGDLAATSPEFRVSWKDVNKSTRVIGGTEVKVYVAAECNYAFTYTLATQAVTQTSGKCDKVTALAE